MTNQDNVTAGLPLFNATADGDINVQAILDEAKIMRARVLGGMLSNAFAGIKAALRARKTARTLDQLSDAVLADIGIERAQIASISRALADGTYAPEAAAATITVIGRTDADSDVKHDDNQPELPLAA